MSDKRKVIVLKGLPGSGKSTWARDKVDNSDGAVKRVNKDDLRAMLDNGNWHWQNEKFVLRMRDQIIRSALAKGYDVIVDDTNLAPKHERQIRALVGPSVIVETIFFDVDVEECIRRDAKREGPAHVGEKVIRDMHNKWESGWKDQDCSVPDSGVSEEAFYIPDETLPKAIICDIDGTLANTSGRSPYDWKAVGGDTPIQPVVDLINTLYRSIGYVVILFSGRDGSCRPETIQWLMEHGVDYDLLYMRDAGDTRGDTVVKSEMFDAHVRDNFHVLFVIDDRLSVIDMWVNRGLFVFNVNQRMEIF